SFFAHHILLPGEKVVVPIQFVLAFDRSEKRELEPFTAQVSRNSAKILQGKTLSLEFNKEILRMSGVELAKKLENSNPKEFRNFLDRQYIVGPSIQLTSVSTGDIQY